MSGRNRTLISEDDIYCKIDEAMVRLMIWKNRGHSWQEIADILSDGLIKISPATARRHALGISKSPKVEMALGLREPMVTVPLSRVKKKRTTKGRGCKRSRLHIDCDPATIQRFDAQRGEMSRREYLERLLDLEFEV